MLTGRRDALGAGSDEPYHLALGIGMFLAAQLNVNHVARHAERHEDHERAIGTLALRGWRLRIMNGTVSRRGGRHVEKTVAFSGNTLYDDVP